MADLSERTIIITGASRGIGRCMALRFARDGANVVIAAKSAEPHPKLKGTIYTVAEEVEAAGGTALPFQVDVRFEGQVRAMVEATAQRFSRIDALVNNAGAISLTNVENTSIKHYDLMQSINARAVFLCSQATLPYLKESNNPHILSLAPPLNFSGVWLHDHAPYTLSKYGMTVLSLGMSEEFEKYGISVNCLWPKTIIATAAIEFAVGSRDTFKYCRKPEIMADAAHAILTTEDRTLTGQCLIDEELLRERGITDLDHYAYDLEHAENLQTDLFIDR
ncbi:MAG: NAD(P)-dependent oxidoreductase [Desulfobacterales bacterium]|jgi:citronellol/citronellal dehydrogenase